jgi:two-component sensor histidine kinase
MIVDEDGKPVDYRFLDISPNFEAYTGLADAKGRTALELVPTLEYHWVETYARVGIGRESVRFENNSVPMGRWFEVCATPAGDHGQLIICFNDITERKQAEEEREVSLARSQRLFEELSHRVKNSLAVVASIISTEARAAPEETKEVLSRVGARITAVSRLYDAISRSGSIDQVASGPYLSAIVEGLNDALLKNEPTRIEADFANVFLTAQQAIPLGLVLNELVTNGVKHAFSDGEAGVVRVAVRQEDGDLVLTVADNGNGGGGEDGNGGLGTRLVQAFVMDLNGTLEKECTGEGTQITVRFEPEPVNTEDALSEDRGPGLAGAAG